MIRRGRVVQAASRSSHLASNRDGSEVVSRKHSTTCTSAESRRNEETSPKQPLSEVVSESSDGEEELLGAVGGSVEDDQ